MTMHPSLHGDVSLPGTDATAARQVDVGAPAPFTPALRSPDPLIEVLDPAYARLRLYPASVERLMTGLRWAEGPVWFGDGRYLLVSDIPNNRILRWDETSGVVSAFRAPSDNANGQARDAAGRLVTCEHLTRRVTRTGYDGRIEVLADAWDGKRLNSPNDVTCTRDGATWFSDPEFGILGLWEGEPAKAEVPHAVYRVAPDGTLARVLKDLAAPNGLAFSPDERTLYVVESRAQPHRMLWAYDHAPDGTLSNKRPFVTASDGGALDGIAVDVEGNVWCGYGSSGQPDVDPLKIDGVRVVNADGKPVLHVHLPERCANLCFGGTKGNRLFMAATHSVYALYVNVQGAVR